MALDWTPILTRDLDRADGRDASFEKHVRGFELGGRHVVRHDLDANLSFFFDPSSRRQYPKRLTFKPVPNSVHAHRRPPRLDTGGADDPVQRSLRLRPERSRHVSSSVDYHIRLGRADVNTQGDGAHRTRA